jgi:ERCC4-related helicase
MTEPIIVQKRHQLRAYQNRIIQDAELNNSIVVLPTGSGKTIIAAEIILRLGSSSLFLVPTCILVDQQAEALQDWTKLRIGKYMGGIKPPTEFDILISTPKAFLMEQSRGTSMFQWSNFKVVVFDEVHHVLKNHPYRKIANSLRKCFSQPRIVGLTASITYEVKQKKIDEAMERICNELKINKLLTASQEELQSDGYHGSCSRPEHLSDVNLPAISLPVGIVSFSDRKPHLLSETFFSRILQNKATSFSNKIMVCIRAMEQELHTIDNKFSSPLELSFKKWGKYCHSRYIKSQLYINLEHWYDALQILIISWEEAEDASTMVLRMYNEDKNNSIWSLNVREKINNFWNDCSDTFPRFDNLKEVLIYKYNNYSGDFRGIIFVNQRIMTHILEYFISNDPELREIFSSTNIYATSTPATTSLSINATQSKERIEAFSKGNINLLIATVVAEEGLDVPAANCVIRFDSMNHAVSFVQGRGRARQSNSSFVVLSERVDRPVSLFENVEKQQLQQIQSFKPKKYSKENEKKAQLSRETGAKIWLQNIDTSNSLSILNIYCNKTKIDLIENIYLKGDVWECELTYESVISLHTVSITSSNKKKAKNEASKELLDLILSPSLKRKLLNI